MFLQPVKCLVRSIWPTGWTTDFIAHDATFTEQWTLYPNGEPKSVMVIFRGFPLPDGRMAMQCEAIGETEETPQNLRSTEALLYTDVLITLFDRAGPPLYMNPAARNALPQSLSRFEDLFLEDGICARLTAQVDIMGEFKVVTRVKTANGSRWYDLSAKNCADAVTGKPALLLTAVDVTALKEARDTARRLADHDQLTDLHNRAYLQQYFQGLQALDGIGDCAAIFFDVDRFKLINDRYGHDAGDVVLKTIADRITANIRPTDLLARLGGDEFVMIVANTADQSMVQHHIDAIQDALLAPIAHDNSEFVVELSLGATTFCPKTAHFAEVLREADLALYASKNAGRNRATFFTPQMGEAARARDQIEAELRMAVAGDEFVLHYQPRLDIKNNKTVAAEGLVRWNHPTRGVVGPNDFISICEETGLIEQLGRRVLEMGCAQAIKWRKAGLDIAVSLNVSPRQFSDQALLDTLFDLSRLDGFPTGDIELEITENALIGDHNAIADKLRQITAMGYKIAIDDFGTGYSNLSYISRFPLSCLKIDRSFIDQLPASGPIVSLILTLGQEVGATIVSEGVETQEQLDWLAQNNCDQAQGYLMSRPISVEDFEAFLDKQSGNS